jgi:uncharacterized damage-inducible protein DinB
LRIATTTIGAAYTLEMAAYDRWQNRMVFEPCERLDGRERTHDRAMFFGSLERTLDHVLMVDRWLLDLVDGSPVRAFDPAARATDGWEELRRGREPAGVL